MDTLSKNQSLVASVADRVHGLNLYVSTRAMMGVGTLAAMAASMQAQMAAAEEGGTADIRGALDANQQGLTAVEESTFTQAGVESGSAAVLNAVLYAVGAAGVIMVVFGIWNLYSHFKDGEQARGSAGTGVVMIIIGGLMTIPAIITAIAPNLFVGGGEA